MAILNETSGQCNRVPPWRVPIMIYYSPAARHPVRGNFPCRVWNRTVCWHAFIYLTPLARLLPTGPPTGPSP